MGQWGSEDLHCLFVFLALCPFATFRVVLIFSPMFSATNHVVKSKRANKRAKRMRAHAGAVEMNT